MVLMIFLNKELTHNVILIMFLNKELTHIVILIMFLNKELTHIVILIIFLNEEFYKYDDSVIQLLIWKIGSSELSSSSGK